MRVLVAALVVAAALTAGAGASASVRPTQLTIAVWPKGREARVAPRKWTLACEPARGTLPRPARACRTLFANLRALRPIPSERACTLIYGGPQEALVTGTVRGDRVWVRFNRRDGCEIDRWNRLAALFPVRL